MYSVSHSEVFHYPTAGDSTLGQKPVKREHSPDEDGPSVSAKKIKLEDGANDVSISMSFIFYCVLTAVLQKI